MGNLARIRLGTRKSALALVQAEEVHTRLQTAWPGIEVEFVTIVTSGDMFTDRPLSDIGGKGLFTKEIEEALLDGRIDIAVHSVKDMQTVLPEGLIIGCMLEREDPRDMLVGKNITSIESIPKGATFGSASLRRAAQILMRRPDLKIVPLRGNVQTRLNKLEAGEMQATMLAKAGLNRLKLHDIPGVTLPITEFLPAVAQGALGIECRAGNTAIRDLLKPLSHMVTEQAVTCERAFLRALDGSCRTPIAGHAEVKGNNIYLRGLIVRPDGSAFHSIEMQGKDAAALGREAGNELLAKAGKNFI
jgi:hydroxymethylbilane synthase